MGLAPSKSPMLAPDFTHDLSSTSVAVLLVSDQEVPTYIARIKLEITQSRKCWVCDVCAVHHEGNDAGDGNMRTQEMMDNKAEHATCTGQV